jgi:predicted permease
VTSLWRDLRFAARMLIKSPGFTVVVVVALALGLGVNTAVFGVIDLLLFRPLKVDHPEQLATIFFTPQGHPDQRRGLSYPDYTLLRAETELFTGVAAYMFDQFAVSDGNQRAQANGERPEVLAAELVTDNYFEVLGLRAALGRTFTAAEGDVQNPVPVIVISDRIWERRFHRDPGVLGRRIALNSDSFVIVGVLPPSFRGSRPTLGLDVDFFVPMAMRTKMYLESDWQTVRTLGFRDIMPIARLAPGITRAQVQMRLEVLAQNLAQQYPQTNAGLVVSVTSETESRAPSAAFYRTMQMGCLLALLIAGLVLLVSCANVANLLLARAAVRSKELAIRLALGAGRQRLVRQLMTESLLLALLGGAGGVLVALWFGDLLRLFLPSAPGLALSDLDFRPDARTLSWALGASAIAGIAFGAVPAWRATRIDLVTALKSDVSSEGQRARRLGLRQLLVVLQLAVSIMVVVAGGLLLRSLNKLKQVDPGFETALLVSGQINPGFFESDNDRVRQIFDELVRRIERRPGVRSVSTSSFMPLFNVFGSIGPIVREGDPPPPPNQGLSLNYSVVYPKYFETVGTQLLVGRDFQPSEREGVARAAIVNQELARRLFGSAQEALGKRFRAGLDPSPLLEIVGVAQDGHYLTLFEDPTPYVFLPGYLPEINPSDLTFRMVLMRAESARDLPGIAAAFREEVQALDGRIPLESLYAGADHIAITLVTPRIAAALGTILGLLALALATLGIYSVMTYTVSRRTKEIGIRMALGGQVRHVLKLVVGQGMRLTVAGVVVGTVGALAMSRLLAGFLYGVGGSDPVTFVVTVVILVAVALLATFIPARRATKVDPMVALRYE